MHRSTSHFERITAHSVLPIRVFGMAACIFVTWFVVGCSGGANNPTGATVSGKVTVAGKSPGPGATVTFIWPDKDSRFASVLADGTYNLVGAPSGLAKITVTSTAAPNPAAGPAIPAKYASPDNGLTYEVKAGQQTHDIDLTP